MTEFAIQSGLYSAVSTASGVVAIGATVRDIGTRTDDVAASFPYVTIGEINLVEHDTATSNGFDAAFRIHTYSNTGSMKQCKDIQAAIYAALHKQFPAFSGYNLVNMYREQTDAMQASSGAIHGVCDYRAILETL